MALRVLFISNICDSVNNALPLGPGWPLAWNLCQSHLPPAPRNGDHRGSPTLDGWFWKAELILKGRKAGIPGLEPRDRGIGAGHVSALFPEPGRRGAASFS